MKRSRITQSQKFDKIFENFASKKAIFGHFGLILRQNLSFINHVIFQGGEGGLTKRSLLITRGEGGVWRTLNLDHEIYERPLIKLNNLISTNQI